MVHGGRAWTVLVLTILFGLQLLRSFITGVSMFLYDAMEVPALLCGVAGLAPIAMAIAIRRGLARLDEWGALLLLAFVVASARLAEQLSGTPLADLVLATVGVAAWISFVPLAAFGLVPGGDGRSFAVGVLCAIALDTAIKGSLATMDLSWVRDRSAYVVVIAAVAVQLFALASCARARTAMTHAASPAATPLFALGPLLVIELMLLQNIGQHAIDSGLSQEHAFLCISIGNAAALLLVARIPLRFAGRIATAAAGTALAVALWARPTGGPAVLRQLAGAVLVAQLALSTAVATRRPRPRAPRSPPVLCPAAAGLAVGLVLVFSYYATYELAIPVDRRLVLPLAALVATAAIVRARGSPHPPWRATERRSRRPLPAWAAASTVAGLLLAPPLYRIATHERPAAVEGTGLPIKVMTYNLHNGFDPDGLPSIERLAAGIERAHPDVVALQEVSRAWLVAGSFDMLEWLSQRLDMPYAWGPSVDEVWGNAVLSRLPLRDAHTVAMPNNDLIRLDRAFVSVDVEAGGGAAIRLFATHLHAVRQDSTLRMEQLEALIDAGARAGGPDVILLGDLNFRQWDPEFDLLVAAGLVDAFAELRRSSAVSDRGPTTRANVRIDYIWMTPSLRATDIVIGRQFASDHLPISVTITN